MIRRLLAPFAVAAALAAGHGVAAAEAASAPPPPVGAAPVGADAAALEADQFQTCVSCTSVSGGPEGPAAHATALRLLGHDVAGGSSRGGSSQRDALVALPSNPVLDLAVASWETGTELGPSEWVTVDQAMIDKFADATGDHQWIHVDVERAKREMPGGKTIAHGYLTLSLVPRMAATLLEVTKRSRGINYGSNKIRFISPVQAGSRIRVRQRITGAEEVAGNGVRVSSEMTVEIEGQERPALVGEIIGVRYA